MWERMRKEREENKGRGGEQRKGTKGGDTDEKVKDEEVNNEQHVQPSFLKI